MFDDNLTERYELAVERIKELKEHCDLRNDRASDYFVRTAGFIVNMDQLNTGLLTGTIQKYSLEQLKEQNRLLYEDVIGDRYNISYANPTYACEQLGEDYGKLLSFLYVEIRGMIVYVYENRKAQMTALMELFIEIFCIFAEEDEPSCKELNQSIYWYMSDYSDDFIEYRIREMLDPSLSFATDIIMNSDLTDLRYLYQYGEYISENELKTAEFLNSLPQEEIEKMAHTFTEGYRIGFVLGNKDLSKKKLVNIRYCVGFERLVRQEIIEFEKLGLKPTIYRAAVDSINKRMHIKIGYYSTSPNKQLDYDHRFDNALYLDSNFVERKLGALKLAYEKQKEAAATFGGPAVMEVFGETPFEPVDKTESLHLTEKQQKLSVRYDNDAATIVNQYIKGEERSFTIIAYPIPEIGDEFEQIFKETVKINTLDYDKYKIIQQTIIDVLDGSEYVEIKGGNGNLTNMRVSLMQITDKEKQTVFENCLADVNIPLGEVFTSPVLKGTEGVLNVSNVYLNDIKFKNLKVTFKEGQVVDYICDNYTDPGKNRALFKENVLYNHDTLPLGEFAIGTNTTAYVMANKYDIVYKLPILIVEKMGPHFAIGDTCYSHSEDVIVYNPNGKEIISKDNDFSLLRKTEPEKAYFNCHTDITIPYDEIGRISAVSENGSRTDIIVDGRFVLKGCEALNEPFSC
jgi:leucyl aminopeptidase (aminopeptidase T)